MSHEREDVMVEFEVPGDKSISHRALILAALADGTSRIRGLLPGADPRATAGVLRALGVEIPPLPADGCEIRVTGRGLDGLRAPDTVLDCGNSGTTARLLSGVLAGCPFSATLTGDDSLRSRPMRRVTDPLSRMGARFVERERADHLPIEVTGGRLDALEFSGPRASAQVKSALLLAGLTGGAPVHVAEPVLSRDHTERMLAAMGAAPERGKRPDGSPDVRLEPVERLDPIDFTVPGDFSSAAFFMALGLLSSEGALRIRQVGVNPTRTGLLGALERMGADIGLENEREIGGEPMADLVVRPSPLRGATIGGAEIPALIDEVPILSVLAARAAGETVISGAAELRVKESDRLAALAANLRAIGVEVDERPDGLIIQGTDRSLAGRVRSFGDHRIAMAFGVLGALPDSDIEVDDPGVVGISFPAFWEILHRSATRLTQS